MFNLFKLIIKVVKLLKLLYWDHNKIYIISTNLHFISNNDNVVFFILPIYLQTFESWKDSIPDFSWTKQYIPSQERFDQVENRIKNIKGRFDDMKSRGKVPIITFS